ncbi:proteinase-activated receptor 1-like [Thamnophis elegans]|uniref:proteinase-activated receptor 1-like n=1 Tax=Thamnophis elegans TaxID=35005 RepID=UPI0013782BCB|nr:proteinase-activated receptor 1-like [Thamnophis elegans]
MGPPLVLVALGWIAVLALPLHGFSPAGNGASFRNDTESILRTFPMGVQKEKYEQIPVLDNDAENDSEIGSGSISHSRTRPLPKYVLREGVEDYLRSGWLTYFVPGVYTLVASLSLPLNITAIFLFLLKMKVKKPAVVYMLNLAFADVLFACVLPFRIVYHFSGNDWPFGPAMCRFVTATFYCNMYCSILLMTVISIDRFLAVVYPMQSLSWRTLRRASVVCVAIWLVSIAAVVPLFITEQTRNILPLNITTCHDVLNESDLQAYYRIFFTIFFSFFFFVPLIVCTVCYVCIIWCLSSSNIAIKSGKRGRALLLSVAVLSIFIICFGPTNLLLLVHYAHFAYSNYTGNIYFAYLLSVCISSVSCCIDPLIYYYASSECQRQLSNLLCCRKDSELCSLTSDNPLGSRTSQRVTGTSTIDNSLYRKLLT